MVVNVETGFPAGARESAIRALLLLVSLTIPLLGWFIEPSLVLLDAEGRRLGDRPAGTQVIETSSYAAFLSLEKPIRIA